MSFASHACHSALLPVLIGRVFGADEGPSEHVKDRLRTLALDSREIGKFKMVTCLALDEKTSIAALETKMIERCAPSLKSLGVIVDSLSSILALCEMSFPNLEELGVFVMPGTEMGSRMEMILDAPHLNKLVLGGAVNVTLLSIFNNTLVNLAEPEPFEINATLFGAESDAECAVLAQMFTEYREVLSRINSWTNLHPDLLLALLRLSPNLFRPAMIGDDNEGPPLSSTPGLWELVRDCDSLRRLRVNLTSTDLLGPLPANLERFEIRLL
jgi:hypothetical protein